MKLQTSSSCSNSLVKFLLNYYSLEIIHIHSLQMFPLVYVSQLLYFQHPTDEVYYWWKTLVFKQLVFKQLEVINLVYPVHTKIMTFIT